MSVGQSFVVSLGVTVALLGGAVFTGMNARRKLHLTCVSCAVVMLGVTIWFAEQLGEEFDLEAAGVVTPVHLTLAKITTLAYLGPIVTGVRTILNPAGRKLHSRVAWTVLLLTVLTAATGLAMLKLSQPIEVTDSIP